MFTYTDTQRWKVTGNTERKLSNTQEFMKRSQTVFLVKIR